MFTLCAPHVAKPRSRRLRAACLEYHVIACREAVSCGSSHRRRRTAQESRNSAVLQRSREEMVVKCMVLHHVRPSSRHAVAHQCRADLFALLGLCLLDINRRCPRGHNVTSYLKVPPSANRKRCRCLHGTPSPTTRQAQQTCRAPGRARPPKLQKPFPQQGVTPAPTLSGYRHRLSEGSLPHGFYR